MIGKTNAVSGGKGDILGEKLNISLRTNQADHSDLIGATLHLQYADVVKEMVWNGKEITLTVPPYIEYSVTFGDVIDYKTPQAVTYTAQEDNSRSVVVEYQTTIVKASVKSNQPTTEDLADATMTISGKTLKNGESAKFATGTKVTPTWSEVTDYKTPTASEMTLEGASVIMEGIYETEVVSVSVSADNGESMNVSVTIDGESFAYSGTAITKKIAFGKTYSVSVSDVEDYITPTQVSYTASMASREVVMEFRYDPATDLSMRDIHGNTIAQNTANCYVVKEAGKYQIPIAYGAAIKNGAANTAAYTNNGGANSHDFVNYLGNVVTSPYVEVDTAKQAASVQMSIADMDNAVSELEIVDGAGCRYVRFKVNEVPAVGANAIISVKDADGVIMWSWHIWLWSDDLTPVEITNSTGVNYNILPVNLATKKDSNTTGKMMNWFYQWGRPNPMLLPVSYKSETDATSYGSMNFSKSSSRASTYSEGIKNPNTFYPCTNNSYYNWFGGYSYYNLWDANCDSSGTRDNNVVKTIYDPCPIGFKMPNGNTFTGFKRASMIGSYNNGWYLKRNTDDTVGIFFPASGYRDYSSGALTYIGSRGYMWLSSSSDINSAHYFNFNSTAVASQNTSYRAYACSVRPVKDDDLALPTHKLTINVSGDTATPSGYTISVYNVMESVDETTGEVTETLGDLIAEQTTASATHEITWGTKYKVVASDVEGFVTPSSVTYTADSVSRSVNIVYVSSKLKVNILSNQENDAVIGAVKAVVSWDGASVEVADGESVSAPTNKEITITFPSVDGYKTPAAITFTYTGGIVEKSGTYYTEKLVVNVGADDGSSVEGAIVKVKEVLPVNGVYIQDVNGKLWETDAWDGSATPNGIAVISSECSFVMALQDVHVNKYRWGGYGTLVQDITTVTSSEEVKTDYKGYLNSSKIINQLGLGATYAAEQILYYVFPNGGTGYLGAAGEWNVAYGYRDIIESALSKCGGEILKSDAYWTSSQYDKSEAWEIYWGNGYIGDQRKDDNYYVRAFASLYLKEYDLITTNGQATIKIPYDTTYEVSLSEKSGYITPSAQTFTASQVSRVVSMQYEAIKDETLIVNVSASDGASVDGQVVTVKQSVANGVYIEDVDGKLWTESEWDGSVTPNGIAVITNECQFVMALADANASYCEWGSTGINISGITSAGNNASAKADYDGETQTAAILNKLGNNATNAPAAYYCNSFAFPNGQKGYLGAAGEWQAALDNKTAIVSALNKCGGTAMSAYYWTSTQADSTIGWCMLWDSATLSSTPKYANNYVRAFKVLGITQLVDTSGKATFTIPNGVTYEVSVSDKDGYATPASQTFTAASGTRTVSMQYLPLKITTIRINQTITDPASMITRIVDKGGIEAVRANSHRYTGTFANGVMTLKQLSDTDGTKYKDGSTATLNAAGVDVWMRLPQFYWKCTQYATDQWDFSVAYGTKPNDSYKEWDGKDLIGVYEGFAVMSQLLSRSGETVSYTSQSNFKDYARARGEGYTLVKWKHHCMMAMLFYMQYGHTNAQDKIGPGNTTNKKTGGTNSLGMTDTVVGGNGSSGSINFWGLENWWGNYYEFIDNVIIDARAWSITEDDGTVRAAGTGCSSNGWTTKMMFGDYMDLIPTIANASASTGFCDYYYQTTSNSRVVARSWSSSSTNGGVVAVDCQYGTTSSKSSYGTRLAFRGEIKIVG